MCRWLNQIECVRRMVVQGLGQERIGVRMLRKTGGPASECVSVLEVLALSGGSRALTRCTVLAQTLKPSLAVKPRIVASGCELPVFRKLSEPETTSSLPIAGRQFR